MIIELHELTSSTCCYGSKSGQELYHKLLDLVQANVNNKNFTISFSNIEMVDSSFARESVIEVIKKYLTKKSFSLTNISNTDIIENLNCAANLLNQGVVVWTNNTYQILGPKITEASRAVIDIIFDAGEITAAQLSDKQKITLQNASTKIKKLFNQGYITRQESVLPTGGIHYLYKPIK